MAAAQADILVVGTQHHLCALLYHMAVFVETGVKGRFFAAPADSFDLLQLVRQHQQVVAAREQVALEVGAETVTDDGDAAVIDEVDEVIDLIFCQKLGFVDDNTGIGLQFCFRHFAHLIEVDAGVFQADAGIDHVVAVAGVQTGFYQQRLLAALLVVEPRHQRVGRFAGAHGAELKIQLCHPCFSFICIRFYLFSNFLKAVGMG